MNRYRFIIKHSLGNYVAKLALIYNKAMDPYLPFKKRLDDIVEHTMAKYECSYFEMGTDPIDGFRVQYNVKFFRVKP